MVETILKLLDVACWHRHLSQPYSTPPPRRVVVNGHEIPALLPDASDPYVVCFDCGRHFQYDWQQMRLMK